MVEAPVAKSGKAGAAQTVVVQIGKKYKLV
jgi:hypothetical protein